MKQEIKERLGLCRAAESDRDLFDRGCKAGKGWFGKGYKVDTD